MVANSRASAVIFDAGTPLIFSAHCGVYSLYFALIVLIFVATSALTSSVTRVYLRNSSPSPLYSPSAMTTLIIARMTARSVPTLTGTHSRDLAAVFDRRTSKVTISTPLSAIAQSMRCATGMWLVWVSRKLLPKFSTNLVLSKSQLS